MEKQRRSHGRKVSHKTMTKKNIVIIENDDNDIKKNDSKDEDIQGDNWCTKITRVKHIEEITENVIKKNDIVLKFSWVLWCHKLSSNDWSLDGFEQLYIIRTVNDFWSIFNNLNHLGMEYMHFYLMKENIKPIWEDDNNRNGGICSIKIEFQQACQIMEDLCSHMVIHELLVNPHSFDEVNGIAFSPKINSRNSFAIVKIWNKHRENDTSKLLNKRISEKYNKLSIQYKQNKPEY